MTPALLWHAAIALTVATCAVAAVPSLAAAKCAQPKTWLEVAPAKGATIHPMETLFFKASGDSVSILTALKEGELTFLVETTAGEEDLAPVRADLIHLDHGGAALVHASRALPSGRAVTLQHVDAATKKARSLGQWAVDLDAYTSPTGVGEAQVIESYYGRHGCRIRSYFTVGFERSVKRDTLVFATFQDSKGETQSYPYWLEAGSEELWMGRGMCGGEFSFSPELSYSIKLEAFDRRGEKVLFHDEVIKTPGPERAR